MMTISIKKNLVSTSKYSLKCPNKMAAEYITVHNTYNDAPAENEVKYMISNDNSTSFHIAVDDKQAIQGIPLDRNAWHCGDGNGTGNRKSIGVEICYSKSGGARYEKAEQNAVILIAQLLIERKWGIDRVKQHHDWSGKNCPHRIRAEGRWYSFLARIQAELDKKGEVNVPETKVQAVSQFAVEAHKWVKENGISDGSRPLDPVTRQEVWVMLHRMEKMK